MALNAISFLVTNILLDEGGGLKIKGAWCLIYHFIGNGMYGTLLQLTWLPLPCEKSWLPNI